MSDTLFQAQSYNVYAMRQKWCAFRESNPGHLVGNEIS